MTETIDKITLDVKGMTCSGCAATVARQLESEGCQDVNVNLALEEATFTRPTEKEIPGLIKGIKKLGYEAQERAKDKTTLDVTGMTCSGCAATVARQLESEGCQDVNVDLALEEATFKKTTGKEIPGLIKGIQKLGYEAKERTQNEENSGATKRFTANEKRFGFAAILALPLLLPMFIGNDTILSNPWLQLILAAPVYLMGAWHFGRSGWASLRLGAPNMDVLIFIGTSAAFGYSLWGTLQYAGTEQVQQYLFYETSATIVALILLGNILENRSVTRTTSAIKDLNKLQVKTALRYTAGAEQQHMQEVRVEDLQVGDLLQVNEGGSIPADGKVRQGTAWVDESMITGESAPVAKEEGAPLTAATLLVEGQLQMEVQRLGKDTTLQKIVAIVKTAQQDKPQIQRLGDKVSAVFVPTVVGIAVLTFGLAWGVFGLTVQQAMLNAVAVLVISCPCAMGLATPTAVMVGLGKAAKKGILIKGAQTMEQLAKVRTVVFDKTGTLTTGAYKVSNFSVSGSLSANEVRAALYALEGKSSHPVAAALRAFSESKAHAALQFTEIKERKGYGIEGTDKEGRHWKVGSHRTLELHTPEEQEPAHDVYVHCNGELCATIDIEDELKEGAAAVVQKLNAEGIQTVMLSGDRKAKCKAVAQQLGLTVWQAEMLPEQKLEAITQYSTAGLTAMVGDGINDAPALARAQVGISFSNATQVSVSAAQVVLLSGQHLPKLWEAWRTSKDTLTTIKQNLFWAFFYNVIAIPVAAVGLLNPMIAALSMAFSDVMVIGNSLRLRVKK